MSTTTDNAINYNFEVSSTPSRYLRAFIAYLKALENWNVEETLACFDDALQHRILPASLGRPVRAKEAYADFWRDVPQIFGGNKFVVCIIALFLSKNSSGIWAKEGALQLTFAIELAGDYSRSHRVGTQASCART